MENSAVRPIGVFDSGVGGISVLADLIQLLPNEKYIYFGDSGNAPYGIKQTEEIKIRSLEIADFLIGRGIKVLVVACNTATSAAVDELRQGLKIPVVGMEPALKPAVEVTEEGNIVVMATPVTLKEKKFDNLIKQFQGKDFIKLPCPGLVEIIETKGASGKEVEEYLKDKFASIDLTKVNSVVLGCTHYVFIRDILNRVLGEKIKIIDGNYGTAKHLQRILIQHNLLIEHKGQAEKTEVSMYNTGTSTELLNLGKELLIKRLESIGHKGEVVFGSNSQLAFKQQTNNQMI